MEDHPVIILAAANLGLEAVRKWTDILLPVLSALVSIGQIAVTIATVVYLVRKTNKLKKAKKDDDEIPTGN